MFIVKVISDFSSAHNLRGYKGRCEELHGHNWRVEVKAGALDLDEIGMVLDFTKLRKELNNVVEELDHQYLNNIEYFKIVNPTSENIAQYIYDQLKIPLSDYKIIEVSVWESDTSCASYIPEDGRL